MTLFITAAFLTAAETKTRAYRSDRTAPTSPRARLQVAPPIKPKSARDAKTSLSSAIPLQMGQVEEDFEVMATDMAKYAPNLDIDLELEVAPNKRLRPVEAVRPSVRLDGPPPSSTGKRKCDRAVTAWHSRGLGGGGPPLPCPHRCRRPPPSSPDPLPPVACRSGRMVSTPPPTARSGARPLRTA